MYCLSLFFKKKHTEKRVIKKRARDIISSIKVRALFFIITSAIKKEIQLSKMEKMESLFFLFFLLIV